MARPKTYPRLRVEWRPSRFPGRRDWVLSIHAMRAGGTYDWGRYATAQAAWNAAADLLHNHWER